MKLWPVYLFFGLLLLFSFWYRLDGDSPELLILGDWREVSWQFEKVDRKDSMDFTISELHKKEILRNVIIHEADTWRFNADRTLSFLVDGKVKENLNWNIKGRGHILELLHKEAIVEGYQVVWLSHDELIVQFNFDLQLRGIVRMTFKKMTKQEHAQKI